MFSLLKGLKTKSIGSTPFSTTAKKMPNAISPSVPPKFSATAHLNQQASFSSFSQKNYVASSFNVNNIHEHSKTILGIPSAELFKSTQRKSHTIIDSKKYATAKAFHHDGKFSGIIVCNRGEVARDVLEHAIKGRLYPKILICTELDANSPAAKLADKVIYVKNPANLEEVNAAIDKALHFGPSDCNYGVHPGYGYLSENADFAKSCEDNPRLTFIGPSSAAINQFGHKVNARKTAKEAGLPVPEGYEGEDQTLDTLLAEAERITYPLVIKTALGGGGKGNRIAKKPEDVIQATLELPGPFMMEKYIENAEHVELQVFEDEYGDIVTAGIRVCNYQKDAQKFIEIGMTPAEAAIRYKEYPSMVAYAKSLLRNATHRYCNAGTVEFLVDQNGKPTFMEMNTRLQVERNCTNLVSENRFSIIELQLWIAQGRSIIDYFKQKMPKEIHDFRTSQEAINLIYDKTTNKFSLQLRIYGVGINVVDNKLQYSPVNDTITGLTLPANEATVLVSSGITEGMALNTALYDGMIMTFTVAGSTFERTLEKAKEAIASVRVNVETNIPYQCVALDYIERNIAQRSHTGTSKSIDDEFIAYIYERAQAEQGLSMDLVCLRY